MDFMSVRDASQLWDISERWVQKLCEEKRIDGVQRFVRSLMITKSAKKPSDLRHRRYSKGENDHAKAD